MTDNNNWVGFCDYFYFLIVQRNPLTIQCLRLQRLKLLLQIDQEMARTMLALRRLGQHPDLVRRAQEATHLMLEIAQEAPEEAQGIFILQMQTFIGIRDFVSRRAPSSPPKPGNVLGIFGLASETNEADIKKIFTEFGNIESVTLIRDKNTDISRGFGFIYFTDIKDAEAAKEKTNGTVIHGREIRVDFSKTQKPHDPTPGQYLGKSRDYPPRRSTDRYGSRSGDRYEGREERYRYESRPYPPRYSSKDGRRERRPYRSRSRSPKPSYYRRSPPPPAYGSSHERSSAPYDRRDRYQPSRPRSRSPY